MASTMGMQSVCFEVLHVARRSRLSVTFALFGPTRVSTRDGLMNSQASNKISANTALCLWENCTGIEFRRLTNNDL